MDWIVPFSRGEGKDILLFSKQDLFENKVFKVVIRLKWGH